MQATSMIGMQNNDGPHPFSQKARAHQVFESFDVDALLNEAFLDDSGEKLDFILDQSRMDIEPEPLSHTNSQTQKSNLGASHDLETRSNNLLYDSRQDLMPFNQLNSSGHHQDPSRSSTQFEANTGISTPTFTQSQLSGTSSYSEPSLSCMASQEMNNQRQNVAGYQNYKYPTVQPQNEGSRSLRSASHFSFGASPSMSTAHVGAPTPFNVGSLQGNFLAPSNNVTPNNLAPAKQDQIATSSKRTLSPEDITVNIQRLKAMEKLHESMKRTAETRSLVQMSNPNIANQDTSSSNFKSAGVPRQPISREGSTSSLTHRSHRVSRHPVGGRGHTRGITVSGRGLGRQGSGRSEGSTSPRTAFGNELPLSLSTTSVVNGMDSSSGHERSKSDSTFLGASSLTFLSQQTRLSPKRGIQKHRSNPTLMHMFAQIDSESMDMTFEGIHETDSI